MCCSVSCSLLQHVAICCAHMTSTCDGTPCGTNRIYASGRVVRAEERQRIAPRGLESLRISMQYSSRILVTRGEFVWEHLSRPYSPGVVAWQGSTCTAKTDFGVQGTRMNRILGDLHGKSVVRLCSIRHIQRCSHAFIDLQTHVPSRGLNLC